MALKVWQYTIPSAKGEGWAYVMIREDGFFATVSDYGNYAYIWSSTGTKDVREFFLAMRRDWDYFAKKLKPELRTNTEQSFTALREWLTENLSPTDLEAALMLVEEHESDDWDGLMRDDEFREFCEEPWEHSVKELCPDVVAYATKIMPKLAALIEAELAQEAQASNPQG